MVDATKSGGAFAGFAAVNRCELCAGVAQAARNWARGRNGHVAVHVAPEDVRNPVGGLGRR